MSRPTRGIENVKERLLPSQIWPASGGGHTLRFHDLGAILAWHRDVVSDREHSTDVMNEMDGRGVAESGALGINCGDTFVVTRGVKDLESEGSTHSSQ